MLTRFIAPTVVLVLISSIPADAQPRGRARGQTKDTPAIRFKEMDRNGDRVIARSEWQGSDQSFRVHDWDGDGVLSGEEVRVGAEPPTSNSNDWDFDGPDREYQFRHWTASGFTSLDHNRDGRLTRDEWHFDRESFRRADHNGDNIISRPEFLATDGIDDDRGDRFADLDLDRNGRISAGEWHGTRQVFNAMDTNHDGALTRVEMFGSEAPPELFANVDSNHDGAIATNEWPWSNAAFNRLDVNHDSRLSRAEFGGGTTTGTRSAAYAAGEERGRAEARAQAREDRVLNQGYDAEGQRELETADSGYEPRFGPKADYQAGYRAGWRRGYPEGWRLP